MYLYGTNGPSKYVDGVEGYELVCYICSQYYYHVPWMDPDDLVGEGLLAWVKWNDYGRVHLALRDYISRFGRPFHVPYNCGKDFERVRLVDRPSSSGVVYDGPFDWFVSDRLAGYTFEEIAARRGITIVQIRKIQEIVRKRYG